MYPTFHTRGTAPMRLLLLLLASVPACLSSPLVVWRWAAQSGAFQDGGRQGHQETLDLNIAQLPPVCPADASLIFISDRTLSASDFTIDSRPRDLEPLLDLMEKSRDVQIDLQVSDMELHGNEEPGKVLMAKLMENCSFTSVTPLSLSIGTADLVRQTLDTAANPVLVVLLGGQHEPDSRSEMPFVLELAKRADESKLPFLKRSLFQKYVFFNTGLFAGLLAAVLLIVCLVIGINVISSVQTPLRFQAPSSQHQQQVKKNN